MIARSMAPPPGLRSQNITHLPLPHVLRPLPPLRPPAPTPPSKPAFLSRHPPLHIPDLPRRDVLPDNLPTQIHKRLVHVRSPSRAGFVIRRVVPGLGDREGAGARDGAVFFEIGLVADDDEGDVGVVFDADDLVAEFVQFGEGGEGGYAEDEEEALA